MQYTWPTRADLSTLERPTTDLQRPLCSAGVVWPHNGYVKSNTTFIRNEESYLNISYYIQHVSLSDDKSEVFFVSAGLCRAG